MSKNNIKENKVDAALILACGLGNRMAPLTFDIPKCFIKVNGIKLIERQIEQLKEKNILEIYICVGYLKEKFNYLIEKYDVKLIYNDEYDTKNTMSTLYKAIPYLRDKNFYICVSDVYYSENPFNSYEAGTNFKGAFIKKHNNDWPCTLDDNNRIIKIEEEGENKYCLVGIAFFTKDDAKTLFSLCDYYYHKDNTDGYYWEHILLFNLDKFENLYMEKLKDGLFNEFDNINELKLFTKETGDFGSPFFSKIANKFNVNESEINDILVLKNDQLSTNNIEKNYKSFEFKIKNIKHIAKYYNDNKYEID